MDKINIIQHKLLHQDSTKRLVEQNLIDTFSVNFGSYDWFSSELYDFINRTGHKDSVIMSKEDLLDYYMGYDTETYRQLSFILEKVDDKDKVEIRKGTW